MMLHPHGTGATISSGKVSGFLQGIASLPNGGKSSNEPVTMLSKKAAYKEAVKSNRNGFKTSRTLFQDTAEDDSCIRTEDDDTTFKDEGCSFKLNEE